MVYNPIFEEELSREKEFDKLRQAIKFRAGKDLFKDLCSKLNTFAKSHPIFTTVAIGVFSYGLSKSKPR